ncbi:MAG: GxxExxY protein [Bacteroidota bacterium]
MGVTKKYLNELTYKVIGCAIEVHKQLGPGLLESVYEKCFVKELELKGLRYQRQFWVPLEYKGLQIDTELRLDVLVEDILCVELKSVVDYCRSMIQSCLPICQCCKNQKEF